MPKRKRPAVTSRSEHWLRVLMNGQPELLNDALCTNGVVNKDEEVSWLSPLKNDDYAEYYDSDFLRRLGINPESLKVQLSDFWPAKGPRWDGLGKTGNKILLIEAKAHIDEAIDYTTQSSSVESRALISQSITKAQKYYSNNSKGDWNSYFYQYANRLAHLYFLSVLNNLNASMIFIYFANAPDVPKPSSKDEWLGHIKTVDGLFALNSKCNNKSNIIIDVSDLSD